MSMYRKFLLKRDFWAVPQRNGGTPTCYVRHDLRSGGIYAYLQNRGVKLVVDGKSQFFNNFDSLDNFLDRLNMTTTRTTESSDFLTILNRRATSKALRSLPL